MISCAFSTALLLLPGEASAREQAELVFCTGNVTAAHAVAVAGRAGTSTLLLQPTREQQPAHCNSRDTGLPFDEIRWLGALASHTSRNMRALTLVRADTGQVTGLEPESEPRHGVRVLSPRADLLPALALRLFGVEPRVETRDAGSALEIACHAGTAPAAAVLRLGRVPAGLAAAVVLEATGDAGFDAQLTPENAEAAKAGTPVASGQTRIVIPPAPVDLSLVVSCPERAAHIRLVRATVEPARPPQGLEQSAWVWEPEAWQTQGDALIAWARRERLGKLLLTIRVENGRVSRPDALADFVRRARAGGLSVVATEGDPEMVSTNGLAHALARAAALADYQRDHADARLAGIQYDIEPYVTPGFTADPAGYWRMWASALIRLSARFGSRVDAVVPFWLLESEGGADALDQAAAVLDRITIMAYRTDTAAVLAAAAPLVEWASLRRTPITIAIEAGALAPERRERFVPAAAGELHVVALGDTAGAILLERPQPAAPGTTAFRRLFAAPADQSRITFHGQPARLRAARAALDRDLAAWPITIGVALHGLDWRGPQTNGGTP
jgi:hypothetical protein